MDQEHRSVRTRDGLRLDVVRREGGDKTPAFCIHGLTRNAADFDGVLASLSATGRDAYAISLRGRGRSQYDPNYLNYVPATYRDDVLEALDQLDLQQAVFIGTSLGGLTTMLAAQKAPERLAGAVINDVGPELAVEGITRIAAFVSARANDDAKPVSSLKDAVAHIREINEHAFPDRDEGFWEVFARRTFAREPSGEWRLAYDPMIGRALLDAPPTEGLAEAFAALNAIPTLLIRGAISDLLSPEIVEKMRGLHPHFTYCEVANTGHAPTLEEPEAKTAIEAFLNSID